MSGDDSFVLIMTILAAVVTIGAVTLLACVIWSAKDRPRR